MNQSKHGYIVILAGFGMNLTFGVLYTWSIFASALIDNYNWLPSKAALPYTVAIAVFAVAMIPAGRLQDRYGAKIIGMLSGLLTGVGLICSSFFTTPVGLIFSFGFLCGAGIGLGYAAATPVAIKWFPANRKGIVTGFVVSGFGLSALYMAPLANYLIVTVGISTAFRLLGIALLIIVVGLASLLIPPKEELMDSAITTSQHDDSISWQQMLKTPIFYILWLIFACSALGGLMIIGHLSKITQIQSGQSLGFLLVAFTAIFNASGRPIAGLVSDKIGRFQTLTLICLIAAFTFFNLNRFTTFQSLLFGAATLTFCYGSLFSIMPSLISDYFGKRTLGVNYGILFSAWGFGGIIGPILAGRIIENTGTYALSYTVAGTLALIASILSFAARLIHINAAKKDTTIENVAS